MSRAEPTLGDLLQSFWCAKYYVMFGALICVLFGVAFLRIVTPAYKAEMIIAPADGYALGDYASSLSADRSISLPFWRPAEAEGVSTDFYRFIHTARGGMAAEILLKDKNVLSGIRRDGSWRYHARHWNAAELSEYFKRTVKIEPIGATPLRRMSYRHPDPDFAAALLRKIHLVADQMICRDRRRQSQARIDYLEKSLSRTQNPDHRKGITDLLMQQEYVQMLANLDEPYAAIIVEPSASGSRPDWPRAELVLPAAFLAGVFLGFLVWSARQARVHE